MRARGLLLVGALVILGGCSTPTVGLLHTQHRVNYSLTDEELKGLECFVSHEVLVRGETEDGPRSILVPEGTAGVVTGVGPHWIEVSFVEGSSVPFLTDPENRENLYWFATRGADGKLTMVKKLPEPVYNHEGTAYSVIHGAETYLMVNEDQFDDLIEARMLP